MHYKPVEFHADLFNDRDIVYNSPPHLDVEVLIGALAVRGKDIIACTREVIDIPIKILEVEVSPGAAYPVVMSHIQSCKNVWEDVISISTPTIHKNCRK